MVGTYNGVGRDGQPTQGGYSGAIVVDENYVLRIPDAIPLDKAAPAAVRGHHHCTRRCGTGTPDRARRSRSSASAGSATWASSWRTRWAPRSRCFSQSLKKMEDGLRLGADEYYATSDPRHLHEAGGHAST